MIAGEFAAFADDAVARHHETNRILADRGTHRAGALGRAGARGELTGYHWGLTRKRAMLGWEAGQVGEAA